MQTTRDPFSGGTESLATTGAGEIQSLRFILERAFGWAFWYRHDTNIRFDHTVGNVIQGAGSGRHVTAVGYHAWSGSARFPVYSTVSFHSTGFWFPRAGTQPRWTVAHHLAVSVGSGIDRDPIGIEIARFHLEALQFHHTVALRFAHSQAGLAAWQYPHITALQVRRPQQAPDGTTPYTPDISDQIIVGHRGVALQLQGASLIPAANALLGYGPSGEYVEAKRISGTGITVAHQAGQLVFSGTGGLPVFVLRADAATLSAHNDVGFGHPELAKHTASSQASFALMFHDTAGVSQSAHWYVSLPTGISPTGLSIDIFSRQGTRTSGTVGWHVLSRVVATGTAWEGARTTNTVYPVAVQGTAGQVLRQSEDLTPTGVAAGVVVQIAIVRLNQLPNGPATQPAAPATEATSFIQAVLRVR